VEITIIHINAEDTGCTTALHLNGVKPPVTADIEDGRAGKISWNFFTNPLPFDVGEIAQKVAWGGVHSAEIEIVEPIAEVVDLPSQGRWIGNVAWDVLDRHRPTYNDGVWMSGSGKQMLAAHFLERNRGRRFKLGVLVVAVYDSCADLAGGGMLKVLGGIFLLLIFA